MQRNTDSQRSNRDRIPNVVTLTFINFIFFPSGRSSDRLSKCSEAEPIVSPPPVPSGAVTKDQGRQSAPGRKTRKSQRQQGPPLNAVHEERFLFLYCPRTLSLGSRAYLSGRDLEERTPLLLVLMLLAGLLCRSIGRGFCRRGGAWSLLRQEDSVERNNKPEGIA